MFAHTVQYRIQYVNLIRSAMAIPREKIMNTGTNFFHF